MEVIILAGGLGTRLRSEVSSVPKCMAPISGKPFLWYLLKDLSKYEDVTHVIISVGYLREIVIDWISLVKYEFPFEIDFAIEECPLGTGGGIRLALEKSCTNDVVVLNGDTYFSVDLRELMRLHNAYSSAITVVLKPMTNFDRYGRVVLDEKNMRIMGFKEKEYCERGFINGGIYVINKLAQVFDGLPKKFSFESSVLSPQCEKGEIFGVIQDGYFIDIGVPADYKKAQIDFKGMK